MSLEKNKKYIHIKSGTEVYTVGRVEKMPEKTPLVIYVTLKDGKPKAIEEDKFLSAFKLE